MTGIVNLNHVRKAKARAEKDEKAKANRILHGAPKHLRKLEKARAERRTQRLENSRLDDDIKDK